MSRNLTYCAVDFDGTMVVHDFPRIGANIGAGPVLRHLVNNCKVKVILNTVRDIHYLDDAVQWCKDNGIELFGVNENPDQKAFSESKKVHADCFIDDLSLGCPLHDGYVDWYEVLNILMDTFANVEQNTPNDKYDELIKEILNEQNKVTSNILQDYGYTM